MSVVEVNVGGRVFTTLESTLTGATQGSPCPDDCSGGFFGALLRSGVQCDRDGSGRAFVDRDADLFEAVLRYLRTGRWICPPGFTNRDVLLEAQFYGVLILPSDFTIHFLRECALKRQVAQGGSPSVANVAAAGAQLRGQIGALVSRGEMVLFAVVPTKERLKSILRDTFLKTGAGTTENIDVDKLDVLPLSEEGVPCVFDDELHRLLGNVRHDAVADFLSDTCRLSVVLEKGGMWFPYSTTQRHDGRESVVVEVSHAPVNSKLHGSLHTMKNTPSCHTPAELYVDPGESAQLHQRFLPVCTAWYVSWEEDLPGARDGPSPLQGDEASETPVEL